MNKWGKNFRQQKLKVEKVLIPEMTMSMSRRAKVSTKSMPRVELGS